MGNNTLQPSLCNEIHAFRLSILMMEQHIFRGTFANCKRIDPHHCYEVAGKACSSSIRRTDNREPIQDTYLSFGSHQALPTLNEVGILKNSTS